MNVSSLQMQATRHGSAALRTGVALAATVMLFYAACTVVSVAAPGPFLAFMNSLFHGMDFSPLMRPGPFSWAGFIQALLVMGVWAFFAGTFFGWLHQRLAT